MKKHILIVEDDEVSAFLLKEFLEKNHYETSIMNEGRGLDERIRNKTPDLVLLDIELPDADGMELCKNIRSYSEVPIIMVTGRVDEVDRLMGLGLGADDYICKPFSPREVVARVKSVLRRAESLAKPAGTRFFNGPLVMDVDSRVVTLMEEEIKLTSVEFDLLKLMMESLGRVFTRQELLSQVLGYDNEGYDRTIDVHVKNVRKKLQKQDPSLQVITTVHGVGYKLERLDQ